MWQSMQLDSSDALSEWDKPQLCGVLWQPRHHRRPCGDRQRLPRRAAATRIAPVPTLPLFSPPDARPAGASPDAGRRVTAPGGYEWWHFEAEDANAGVLLVATLYDGCPFHPAYLRAHARYLHQPTRVAPAVPAQYPCVSIAISQNDRPLARSVTQFSPGSFQASDESPEARVGPHSLTAGADGALQLHLAGAARLAFRRSSEIAAVERRVLSRQMTGADHFWVLPSSRYDVEGTINLPNNAGAGGAREVAFRGRGYHDHHYGTAPIGTALRRWIRGWAAFEGQVRTFHIAQPRDLRVPDEHHFSVTEAGAFREVAVRTVNWGVGKRTGWALRYSDFELLGDQPGEGLRLRNGRVIGSTPFSLRVHYDATDGHQVSGGRAFCEIIHPQRLRLPGLGRAIERGIKQADAGT